MANLREIFIKYDIQYPTTAKKADLVDIFKTHVAPKAKEFLKLESGMPSDAGIVDAPKRGVSIILFLLFLKKKRSFLLI